MTTKVYKYLKLLLENKWLLMLIVGIVSGTATNADRIISHHNKAVVPLEVVQLAVKPHKPDHLLKDCKILMAAHEKSYH